MHGWLALDKRSLGLMRIGLGLILTLDVLSRAIYLRAHYSWSGILPLRGYLEQPDLDTRRWSLFFQSDSEVVVGVLLLCYLAAAVSLTVGYKPRLAGWVCWIMAVGLIRRNPLLCDSGDSYLAVLIFWGNFLPWGESFAVGKSPPKESAHTSLAGFCYLSQIAIVYWFSAVLRTGKEWQVDASALYYALQIEPMAVGLNPVLLSCGTGVLAFLTAVTLLFETFGPILLFLPSARARILAVLCIMAFHAGILFTLFIPVFAMVCIVAPLGLLPKEVWQTRLGAALEARLNRIGSWGPRVAVPAEGAELGWRRRFESVYRWLPLGFLLVVVVHLRAGIDSLVPVTFLSGPARVCNLDQRWGMFSPHAANYIGWESIQAKTESGRVVNLLTGTEYSAELSRIRTLTGLGNHRWRLYFQALNYRLDQPIRYLVAYFVARWNESHPDDEVVAAQYLYHPRVSTQDYLLGEEKTEVLHVYHRPVSR